MQFTSPLRYPGGKGRLAQFIADVMEASDLVGEEYVEVYAGGAGVAITLLLLDYAKKIHINDLNRSVHAFWHSVLNEPSTFCSKIRATEVTIDEWHRQRAVQFSSDPDIFDLGFSTFFLNRTNRSGILLGGVIGGKGQEGKWKIDARFNKPELISRIEAIASHSHRIKLYNMDAKDLIDEVIPTLPSSTFIYLDPPYRQKGAALYENNYVDADHRLIANAVQEELKNPWIVSYDNDPVIAKLYEKSTQLTFDLFYSAGTRYRGNELIVHSPSVRLPGEIVPRRTCRG